MIVATSAPPRASRRWTAGLLASVALSDGASGQESRPTLPAAEEHKQSAVQPASTPEGLWDWRPAPLTDPLVTDRPDFTESVETIPRGHLQFESGYTFTRDSEHGDVSRSHTAPEALLRTGLTDSFELRIGWEGYSWVSERAAGFSRAGRHVWLADWSDAAADMSLGFKQGICEQDGWRPALGVIGAITAPSGNAPASSGDVDPEGKLLWAYDLTDTLSLAGNMNLAVPTEDARRFVQSSASVSLGVDLTEQVGLYTEYYGFYPAARGSDCAHTANGGLTWKLTDNLQLDWRAGFGLNEQADDFFTGVGVSIRF
jgi:hypothetical protein